jgi:hypothetical protein
MVGFPESDCETSATASRSSTAHRTAPSPNWPQSAICGDEVTAAAMIDRLVHHAEILALKDDSHRLKDRDLARTRRPETDPLKRRARRSCHASANGLGSAAPVG